MQTNDSPFRVKVQGARAAFEVTAQTRTEAESITRAALAIHRQYAPCKHCQASIDLFVNIGEVLDWQPQIRYLYLPKIIYCDFKFCDKESPAAERIVVWDTSRHRMTRHICQKHLSDTVENPSWLFGRNGEMKYLQHERISLVF